MVEEFVCVTFFFHWPVSLFTVKAVQEFFFSNLPPPPPPPKVKWFALKAAALEAMYIDQIYDIIYPGGGGCGVHYNRWVSPLVQ